MSTKSKTPAGGALLRFDDDFINCNFETENPLAEIVPAIVSAASIPKTLSAREFIRAHGKFFPAIPRGWLTPVQNFWKLSTKKGCDVGTATELIVMAYVLGVDTRVTVPGFPAFEIRGGDVTELLASPGDAVRKARFSIVAQLRGK